MDFGGITKSTLNMATLGLVDSREAEPVVATLSADGSTFNINDQRSPETQAFHSQQLVGGLALASIATTAFVGLMAAKNMLGTRSVLASRLLSGLQYGAVAEGVAGIYGFAVSNATPAKNFLHDRGMTSPFETDQVHLVFVNADGTPHAPDDVAPYETTVNRSELLDNRYQENKFNTQQ